jgi:hypothetical protein
MTPEEREWLIKQDFDKLLKLNTQTQIKARSYVKKFYLDIRNNVESMDPVPESIIERYSAPE